MLTVGRRTDARSRRRATNYDGKVYSKAEDLESHRTGSFRIQALTPSERRVLDLGDTALVSVRMQVVGETAGELVNADMRYTRVWALRDGQWRVVAGHLGHVLAADR